MRDNFTARVVRRLADRAGHRCSNPDCRRDTSGPNALADDAVNVGVAAHITAAAAGGPRFESALSRAQRQSVANGIWLCQWCAKLVDSDVTRFTKEVLIGWKAAAEGLARLRLQVPENPRAANEPLLYLPKSDPSTSWLPFTSRATTFVGRDAERAQLVDFLQSNRKFAWWLVTGAAGSGKSRLGLEFCYDTRPVWNSGFLSRTEKFVAWSHFRPMTPTLIIVDYVASRASEMSAMVLELSRAERYLSAHVRVLLVERNEGAWWRLFLREESLGESSEISACLHADPLNLGPLAEDALRGIATEVAGLRDLPWTESTAAGFGRELGTFDPLKRPLFTMMAVGYSVGHDKDVDSALVSLVLRREAARRREVISDEGRLRKIENLVALATLVGGLLPRDGTFTFLESVDVAHLLPNPDELDHSVYSRLTLGPDDATTLAGLQPDVLGERFVLDRLAGETGVRMGTLKLLAAAWRLQPGDVIDFVVRAASDFPGHPGMDALCALPLDSPKLRASWGQLVGSLIVLAGCSSDQRTQRLLTELRELADRHTSDRNLQNALARAEFSLGNVFLFAERNSVQAASQFEAAIARAGPDSEIGAAAINNRGILNHQAENEARAFEDWSNVISRGDVSDEARACSLNNRADIFARHGAHEHAIRDRSTVLSLAATSPDRRFIALIRRSMSYVAIGRQEDALEDLRAILATADITPQQKAQARVERGVLFRKSGQFSEANGELGAVFNCAELFPGTAGEALVELAEVARLGGDRENAHRFLDQATSLADTNNPTHIEALVVRARLLIDEGSSGGADNIWQGMILDPNASARQRWIAANSGAEPPSPNNPTDIDSFLASCALPLR